ncbi:MAG: hypothetical protein KKB37_17195, partial [Alphaproteobacteria bacterium]|nr:hypothetical protein [Alphaproteobacteria bacterium]
MKLHVIGYKGVVGGVTYELFKRLGYEVTGSDEGNIIKKADIYFICVPEDIVGDIVPGLVDPENLVPIVIRSSVVPGTCRNLVKLTRYCHICHNPEFLREAIAIQDEFSPSRIVIGQCFV